MLRCSVSSIFYASCVTFCEEGSFQKLLINSNCSVISQYQNRLSTNFLTLIFISETTTGLGLNQVGIEQDEICDLS